MEEQRASSWDWSQATSAWAGSLASWKDAEKKNPYLSADVGARWAWAARSWGSAAHAWAPGSDVSWLPGNHAWTSGSRNWAAVARRWATASGKWAAAAERYPACAPESLPCADSAVDWASASVAWAKPQTLWEEGLGEWAEVGRLFAVSCERAAEVAVCAWAVRGLPLPRNYPWSVAVAAMENTVYGCREGAEVAPVAKVPHHSPCPTHPSVSGAESGKATQENPAAPSVVVGAEPSATEKVAPPQDQARADEAGASGKRSLAEEAKSVAVDRAGAEKANKVPPHDPHPPSPANPSVAVAANGKDTQESVDSDRENHAAREDTAPSVAGAEPSVTEKVAPPQDQARADETGTSGKRSLTEEAKSVAVDRAAAKKPHKVPPHCPHPPSPANPSVAVTENGRTRAPAPRQPSAADKAHEASTEESKAGELPDLKDHQAFPGIEQSVTGKPTPPKPEKRDPPQPKWRR